jgi:hypothetical protein
MARLGAAVAVLAVLAGAASAAPSQASADEVPVRKAGLWEVRTVVGGGAGNGLTLKQCIDDNTDRMMNSLTGPLAETACPRLDVKRAGDTVTVDAACTVLNKTATTRAVITGSFERAYEMQVTAHGDAMPAVAMTVTGTFIGPCAAGQKPGDLVMPGGIKLNIVEMRKLSPSLGIPLPR